MVRRRNDPSHPSTMNVNAEKSEYDGKGSEKERDDGRDGESHFPSHMLLLNLSFRISHTVVFGEGIYMW
jgi:hypothetical protein